MAVTLRIYTTSFADKQRFFATLASKNKKASVTFAEAFHLLIQPDFLISIPLREFFILYV